MDNTTYVVTVRDDAGAVQFRDVCRSESAARAIVAMLDVVTGWTVTITTRRSGAAS